MICCEQGDVILVVSTMEHLGFIKTNGVKKFSGTHHINYCLIDNDLSVKSDYALNEYCCKVSQREKLTLGD